MPHKSSPTATQQSWRPHDRRALNQFAAAYGFIRTPTKGGHVRFIHVASGASVVTGSTPSDRRSIQNAVAALRRVARGESAR
jgi:hypothetical protein